MKEKKKWKRHKITQVVAQSIAEELGIEAGDFLLSINEEVIVDVFDYRYLLADECIIVVIEKADGEQWEIEIEKDYEEDLGLVFETELMDELISCRNKCQFCFIDQLPPNMRKTVYLKDDDWRMSFLNGNYITLTNMKEEDIARLIKYHLSPINISIHATDKEVRTALLNNRFAGNIMDQIRLLVENGIEINGQIVLCKGLNDGEILDKTISDLSQFIPHILSLTVVPVGISRFRENLPTLEGFDKPASRAVINVIEKWQAYYLEKMNTRFVFAADEFFVTGEVPLPTYESYEGFPVLDNGVGMLTKFEKELEDALATEQAAEREPTHFCIATGCITETFMKTCVATIQKKYPMYTFSVFGIPNDFFGEKVTVTGLITGQDLVTHLKKQKNKGNVLLIAENMLKYETEIFLDDYTMQDVASALDLPIEVMPNDGGKWLERILRTKEKNI